MRFQILGSGSAGNAALLTTPNATVLVDAGFSARKLDQLLLGTGVSLATIDAIFVTHEHGDHAAGIEGLSRFPNVRVFANDNTARAIQARIKHRANWRSFETGSSFEFADLHISAFSVPHDAQDPVGFCFTAEGEGKSASRASLTFMTDLGHIPEHATEFVQRADVLVVEANHCPEMLEADTRRPWATKQRIKGRHGHLSNLAVRQLIESASTPRWKHVFFTHLSKDCNSIEAVERACRPGLLARQCGFTVVAAGGSAQALAI